MVLLRKTELFKTVIPSKIFEAMAMERPIILGVEGESREIVERSNSGIYIEPKNADQLADAVLRLYRQPQTRHSLGTSGRTWVENYYNRDNLAMDYLGILEAVRQVGLLRGCKPAQVGNTSVEEKPS